MMMMFPNAEVAQVASELTQLPVMTVINILTTLHLSENNDDIEQRLQATNWKSLKKHSLEHTIRTYLLGNISKKSVAAFFSCLVFFFFFSFEDKTNTIHSINLTYLNNIISHASATYRLLPKRGVVKAIGGVVYRLVVQFYRLFFYSN